MLLALEIRESQSQPAVAVPRAGARSASRL
jgi:hypothetical protein